MKIKKLKKIILTLLIIISSPYLSFSQSINSYKIILTNNKISISDNNKTCKNIKDEINENIIISDILFHKKRIYIITEKSGIYFTDKSMNHWKNISSAKFKKRSVYYNDNSYRKISGFAVNDKNTDHLVLSTKHNMYETYNNGKKWNEIKLKKSFSKKYITSLKLSGKKLYIGTSYSGIFIYKNGKIKNINKGLPGEPYSKSFKFYNEIKKIELFNNTPYAISGIQGNLMMFKNHRWKKIYIPGKTAKDIVQTSGKMIVSTNKNICYLDSKNRIIKKEKIKKIKIPSLTNEITAVYLLVGDKNIIISKKIKSGKNNITSNRYALYAPVNTVKRKNNKLIRTIKTCGFNSVVIDMKDDVGRILYPSKNKTAHKIKTIIRHPIDIQKLLKNFKKNNIYSIARIVVFKDRALFRAYNGKYAIKNINTGRPWKGLKAEYWVDPYSTDVHKYNIEIAHELEKIGFDEIQFDYIRFPIDGPVRLCSYSHKKFKNSYKSEILCDFLKKAKEIIKIPISVDIYGFNSWYRFGNTIGQDMEEFSRIVDVICPMVYPSHFGRRFYMKGKRKERSYRIIKDGGIRASNITGYKTVIRPYLQAFKMMSPTWGTGYIKNQIKGAEDSGCSGLTFWNARGDYKILIKSLSHN